MVWEMGMLIAAGAAMSAGCLVPNRWLPASMPNDKLMHFAAFGVLTALALRVAQDRTESLLWIAGLLLLGWLIECLQQLLPDRGFSWRDMLANAAGIAFSAVCALAWAAL